MLVVRHSTKDLTCSRILSEAERLALETRVWRPPRGPSTRNKEAPSASSSTARLSTVFCDRDLRSRSVATSRTMPRKKSLSPWAFSSSRLAERFGAGAHCGSLILDSMSRDSMLIELGGSDVYLQDKGICDSKWPWPALTKTTLEAELYFLRHDLTACRSAGQEFTDL
jgi:hypothetical protein